jgi:uncharacterized FlaG/YvyC family protein
MSPDLGEGERHVKSITIPKEKPLYAGEPRKALRLESLRRVVLEPPPPVPDAEAEGRVSELDVSELDREGRKKALSQAADLLSAFDRELKYEVLEEAEVVQIQVIDVKTGRIVRKIPADEVIKFIKTMKEKIDDRVDVLA